MSPTLFHEFLSQQVFVLLLIGACVGAVFFAVSFLLSSESKFRLAIRYTGIALIGMIGSFITLVLMFPFNILYAYFPNFYLITIIITELVYSCIGYLTGSFLNKSSALKKMIMALILLLFPVFSSIITIGFVQFLGNISKQQLSNEGYYVGGDIAKITSSSELEKIYTSTKKEAIPYDALARNPNTPDQIRKDIFSQHPTLINEVAGDPKLSPILLTKIYSGANEISDPAQKEWVLGILASNPSTPHEIIQKFISENYLLDKVALNPNLSSEQFQILAKNPDTKVRSALTWNKNIPTSILEQLANDSDNYVVTSAKRALQTRQAQ